MKKIITLFLVWLVIAEICFAKDVVSDEITSIAIHGLKRTKLRVIEHKFNKFLGRDSITLDLIEVEGAVQETEVLDLVSISVSDDLENGGKRLEITVSEKWSIIPLPLFFASSDGSIGGGGIFMDSNSFGLRHRTVIDGTYQNTGWRIRGQYIAKSDHVYVPGWRTLLAYADEERTDADSYNEDYRRFNQQAISAAFEVSYPLNEYFQFNLQLGMSF